MMAFFVSPSLRRGFLVSAFGMPVRHNHDSRHIFCTKKPDWSKITEKQAAYMKSSVKVRDSILDSASWLFDRFGYEKTSVDEIARRAHRAKTSVYYYFDGKLSIFKAVLQKEFDDVRAGLEDVRARYSEDIKGQLVKYLTLRMSLLHSAKVYVQYMNSPYIYGNNEISEVVDASRADFDRWEKDYFMSLCRDGQKMGPLSESVEPEAFAKLLEVLLKGIEIQFFHSGDYESMRITYETMVELLVSRTTK